jgi:iron(III) transport system permease protein
LFKSIYTYKLLGETLLLAGGGAIVGTLIALYFAWIATRSTLRWSKVITPIMVVNLLIPQLFFALSWEMIGAPQIGPINELLKLVGIGPVFNINGWPGLLFVTILKITSLQYLVLLGPCRNLDPGMEEAAQVSGRGLFRSTLDIDLPLLRPAMLGAAGLGFLLILTGFSVPELLGASEGIRVFGTELYDLITNTLPANYTGAAALGLVVVILAVPIIIMEWRLLRNKNNNFVTLSGRNSHPGKWDLGYGTYGAVAAITLFAICGVILPLVQLFVGSLEPVFGYLHHLSFVQYTNLFNSGSLVRAVKNTVSAGALGALVSLLVGYTIVYWALHSRGVRSHVLTLLSWLPWTVPGTTMSLAILWLLLIIPGLHVLYGTSWPIVFGFALVSLPLICQTAEGVLVQVGSELEEAAQVYGASRYRILYTIILPLILPSVVIAWFLSFLFISGNLYIPILLAGSNSRPLSVLIFDDFTLGGNTSEAAAIVCLFIAVIGIVWIMLSLGLRGYRKVKWIR